VRMTFCTLPHPWALAMDEGRLRHLTKSWWTDSATWR
jgi:hypothetical protein